MLSVLSVSHVSHLSSSSVSIVSYKYTVQVISRDVSLHVVLEDESASQYSYFVSGHSHLAQG